jgi:hypothetical protein
MRDDVVDVVDHDYDDETWFILSAQSTAATNIIFGGTRATHNKYRITEIH